MKKMGRCVATHYSKSARIGATPGFTLPMLSTATFPAAGCRPSASISKEDNLRNLLKIYMVILALCAVTVRAQEKLPLKLIATTPMPGFTGDFDHFGLDRSGNRLFLAAEEHKTVEVFDLRTGARTHSIEGFGHPLILGYLPESNQLVVTDGDASAVHLVDCTQYKIVTTIKLIPDVDHAVLNPVNKYYYVESGRGPNAPPQCLTIIPHTLFNHHSALH